MEDKTFLVTYRPNGVSNKSLRDVPYLAKSFTECVKEWLAYSERTNIEIIGIVEVVWSESSNRYFQVRIPDELY